jgi:hypothetical protein
MDTFLSDNKLNLLDPDYYIEEFWCGFKNAMLNFYSSIIKIKTNNDIKIWSMNLNKLKKEKKYTEIECSIRDYIALYSLDLIKYSDSYYHDEILITNIKRWDKISNRFNFIKSNSHGKILCLFKIYLFLKKDKYHSELLNKLEPIEQIIQTENYDEFIKWGLINEKTKILNLLSKINNYNLEENIKRLFPNFIFAPKTNPIKLCQQFKKYYSNNY